MVDLERLQEAVRAIHEARPTSSNGADTVTVRDFNKLIQKTVNALNVIIEEMARR